MTATLSTRLASLPFAFTDESEVPVLLSALRAVETSGHMGCANLLIERLDEEMRVHALADNWRKREVVRGVRDEILGLIG